MLEGLEEAPARAARGAALMDREAPGWVDKVDTDCLDIGDDRACVFGQVYGSYFVGKRAVFGYGYGDNVLGYGFIGSVIAGYGADIAALNTAWRDQIAARRVPVHA